MDRPEFRRRLERAGVRARAFAETYVRETLPEPLVYTLPRFDDPVGTRGPAGTLKYFGGRFLRPEELALLSSTRAANLLWVDGRVPAWINIKVRGLDSETTHIELACCHRLVPADERTLGRDLPAAVDPTDPVEPFRIRGPEVPHGWRSVAQDGRVSLLARRETGPSRLR